MLKKGRNLVFFFKNVFLFFTFPKENFEYSQIGFKLTMEDFASRTNFFFLSVSSFTFSISVYVSFFLSLKMFSQSTLASKAHGLPTFNELHFHLADQVLWREYYSLTTVQLT